MKASIAAAPIHPSSFIPHPSSFGLVLPERFELINLLVLSQAPLPIGLREQSTTMNHERGTMKFGILNSSFIVPNSAFRLVDLARFERATSTFAQSRSDSSELQVQTFSAADCQLPICMWTKMTFHLERPIGNWQSKIGNVLAERARVELARLLCSPVFGTGAVASYRLASPEEGVGFEPTGAFAPLVFKTIALSQALPTFR